MRLPTRDSVRAIGVEIDRLRHANERLPRKGGGVRALAGQDRWLPVRRQQATSRAERRTQDDGTADAVDRHLGLLPNGRGCSSLARRVALGGAARRTAHLLSQAAWYPWDW